MIANWHTDSSEVLSGGLSLCNGVYYADIFLPSHGTSIKVALHGVRNSTQALEVLHLLQTKETSRIEFAVV